MSFALDLNRFVNRTVAQQNQIVKKIVLDVDKAVVKKSPVGNPDLWLNPDSAPPGYAGGRFRANWQLGIDEVPAGELDVFDESGAGTLALHRSQMPAQAAGHVYYLVNNLPYAQALEDGHSTQSPPGSVVAGTVAEFNGIVSRSVG